MKKTLTAMICATIVSCAVSPLNAAAAKKNDPNKREVEKILEEIGEPHFIKYMRVSSLCTLRFEDENDEDIFYHIYTGSLKDGSYHVIVFDNTPEYLGYYETEFEPVDSEETQILLDSGESDGDGDTDYIYLPLTIKGPANKLNIEGIPTKFVKNPNLKEVEMAKETTTSIPIIPKETADNGEIIDYRDWKITMKGREITVNAKFEKIEKGQVYIKNAKNGVIAPIPGSALSDEDKEYVKLITAK